MLGPLRGRTCRLFLQAAAGPDNADVAHIPHGDARMSGTYTNLLVHIVFSTKERRPLIASRFEEELYKYIGGIVRGQKCIQLAIGGIEDHLHILVKVKPTIALSNLVRDIKANSTGWINEKHYKLRKFAWQDGFAAFTVSFSQVERVKAYIRNQKRHHAKVDYKSELLTLLAKNQIEYDEKVSLDVSLDISAAKRQNRKAVGVSPRLGCSRRNSRYRRCAATSL
jgi:REP element-mobilizing transposase RayT